MEGVLPPLRRKILRGFLLIVGIFGVLGFLLFFVAVWNATNLTPQAIHYNYDSIQAAIEMKEAWHILRHPDEHLKNRLGEAEKQFDKALEFQKGNTSEVGEKPATTEIAKLWEKNRGKIASASTGDSLKIDALLAYVVEINREGLFRLVRKSEKLRYITLGATILFFILGLIITVMRADSFSMELSEPLKQIAETLRNKPKPGTRLKLPMANSLEVRILIQEIRSLWERVSASQALNLEQIMKQSRKLQAVLTSIEDAILVLDNEGKISHCNERFMDLVGLSEKRQVIDQVWNDLPIMSENYLKLRDILNPTISDERVFDVKVNGNVESYAGRVRVVTTDENEPIATVYLLHDVTEKRQRERLKSEMVGVLSHELRTPVQSMGTAAEILFKRRETFAEDTKLLIETIYDDVSRIRSVAQDFLQISQGENRALRIQMRSCDLGTSLSEWLKPSQVVANDKRIQVKLQKTPTDGKFAVSIDPLKFQWVISNLMYNAIRVAPAGSEILVGLFIKEKSVVISVADEGPGISPELRLRVFDPYYKGAEGGFLGIGLTIAREVVEAHRGEIQIHSREPRGTEFRVMLPSTAV